MTVRTASELADVPDPAWAEMMDWVERASSPVRVIAASAQAGERTLHRIQVSARSVLGALALNCGGLVADHGWFRILGAGGEGLPDLATASSFPDDPADVVMSPGAVIVAFDLLGGCFAIDGGGLGVEPGEVCYFGPDLLEWEGLGCGHSDFVHGAITGGLADTFAALRWGGWKSEAKALTANMGLAVYPPPFSLEGKDLAAASRRAVPLAELVDFYRDAAAQLGSNE